jgi:hypothetical protein
VTITVPDSDLAKGATILARSVEPGFLVEHSFRTFHLGAALLSAAGQRFDAEILYVASMLHDVALGTELDDGVTPFNLRGAGLAARHVLEGGGSDNVAQLVYDAISLHLDPSTGQDERPEVAGVHIGAAADVVGLNVSEISPAVLEAVLAEHPRHGMKTAFAAVVEAEATKKPYSEAAALIHNLGFLQLIHAAPFED